MHAKTKPARRVTADGLSLIAYLERAFDEERDRLEADPERFADEPERFADAPDRFEPLLRVDPERLAAEVERFADERFADERFADERVRLDAELERLADEPELRDPLDERLEPFDELRERLDEERRELARDLPLRRSAAGISSFATAFASCGICFSRNLAIRSSSRRMPRASFAVSLSFTASASASMPV